MFTIGRTEILLRNKKIWNSKIILDIKYTKMEILIVFALNKCGYIYCDTLQHSNEYDKSVTINVYIERN